MPTSKAWAPAGVESGEQRLISEGFGADGKVLTRGAVQAGRGELIGNRVLRIVTKVTRGALRISRQQQREIAGRDESPLLGSSQKLGYAPLPFFAQIPGEVVDVELDVASDDLR